MTALVFVLPQREYGGLHRLVESLLPRLVAADFTVHAIVPMGSNALERMSSDVRVATSASLCNPPSPKRPAQLARHLATARRRASAVLRDLPVRPDIVHAFGFTDFVGAPLARRAGASLVRSANSSIVPPPGDAYARAVMGRADGTLFEGTVLAWRYGPRGSSRPSAVFYPAWDGAGSEGSRSRQELRSGLGIPEDAFLVGTWSNVTRQKGVESFVRYAASIARHDRDTHFLVAGRVPPGHDPYLGRVRRGAAQLPELQGRLHFAVDGELDRGSIFVTLDVLAQTSAYEGVATSTVEAMAAGLPVVAHDVGSVSDLVTSGETGALIAPGDVQGFTDAVLALTADPALRQRCGAVGRARVADLCTSERLASAYLSVYEAVRDGR